MEYGYPNLTHLGDLFQMNSGAFQQAQDQMSLADQFNRQNLAAKQQQFKQTEAMNPLDIEAKRLGNQTTQARLPGIQAESAISGMNRDKQAATQPAEIESLFSQYQGKIQKQDLDNLTNMGMSYTQAAPLFDAMPGMIKHSEAKKILGKNYRPEFDQVPPEALGTVIGMIGKQMTEAATAFQQKLALQNNEQLFKQAENEKRRQSAENIAAAKNSVQKAIADAKGSKDPKTIEQVIATLIQARNAYLTTDPAKADMITEQLNEAIKVKSDMDVRARAAGATGKIDAPAATGMPGVQVPEAPQVGAPKQTAPKPTASPKTQAEYDALLSGTVYQDTDGSIKRKK